MKLESQNAGLKQLQLENEYLKELIHSEKDSASLLHEEVRKKRIAQKAASHYRQMYRKLKATEDEITRETDNKVRENNAFIQMLESEIEDLTSQITEKVKTKEKDGSFTDNLRMCVIELSGLEVATQKVSPVIMCISKHLFGKELQKDDLQSSTTVQSIVDEGHFLAKTFISDEIAQTEHWGINRDGTIRKKQKIVDTSVTLASGSIISLGFNRVSRETANVIHSVTKEHLTELADIHNTGSDVNTSDYIKTTLHKLAFCMSDRASNEKKASELLSEWREEFLREVDNSTDTEPILRFYCMAHVLLGFHIYCCKDLQEYEKDLVKEHGQLGRDSLSIFRSWKSKGTVLERVVRTTSEVFGPAGDHHGIRDLWEAFCRENGVKSIIGNYRDNRFNAPCIGTSSLKF